MSTQVRDAHAKKKSTYHYIDGDTETNHSENREGANELVYIPGKFELHWLGKENGPDHLALGRAEAGTHNHREDLLVRKVASLNNRGAAVENTFG